MKPFEPPRSVPELMQHLGSLNTIDFCTVHMPQLNLNYATNNSCYKYNMKQILNNSNGSQKVWQFSNYVHV